MPSKVMDLQGLSSSSYISQDICFPSERQVGFWKPDTLPDNFGVKMDRILRTSMGDVVATPPLGMERQSVKDLECSNHSLSQDQELNLRLENNAVGAERGANNGFSTSWRAANHEMKTMSDLNLQSSYFMGADKINTAGSHHENGLFSSSLSELFSKKLRLQSNTGLFGHSVDTVASHYEDEEPLLSLEEIEAQTIGNLLPNDDDLLFGMTDGLDSVAQPSSGDDVEDLDFFSSVGGMDLEDDEKTDLSGGISGEVVGSTGSIPGEHPYGEHPSRTLFVRNINSNVEDSELRVLFEHYGDIRTLYTACKHRGFVMISYYDIRAARNAMRALQNKSLRRRKLDIHYSIPKDNPPEKDMNQGTLVVFNLDSSVSNEELHQIFGVYGEIKEIRESPNRSSHKFIEFYDVRAAEAALHALNRSDIAGKQIKLEPSRPGGVKRLVQPYPPDVEQDEGPYLKHGSTPNNSIPCLSGLSYGTITSGNMGNGTILGGLHSAIRSRVSPFVDDTFPHMISSSVPNSLTSQMRVELVGNPSAHSQSQLKFDYRESSSTFHPHSLPEYHDGLGVPCNSMTVMAASIRSRTSERLDNRQFEMDEGVFGSSGRGDSLPLKNHYMWSNSHRPQPANVIWQNSSSVVNGICTAHSPQPLHGLPRPASHIPNVGIPINNHYVGSAPAINPHWETHEGSGFHPGSLGSMRNSLHPFTHSIFPPTPNMELPVSSKNVGLHFNHQRCLMFPGRNQIVPMMNSFDPSAERSRSRRNDGTSHQVDNKKQYELDIDRILRGEDNRTTLMIKNIPNKYTSKMLLSAIDERHRGTYDFLYLPIDFKNKCNVGYAFINMIGPSQIIPFYQAFNGKKWEKFNSEKVASLAYARIQGKAALVAHFQNSSLMNEDKRCRPILFHTDGPNAGDQVPFPMGVNIRSRPTKTRTNSNDEQQTQGSPPNSACEEALSNGNLSGSVKESD